MQKRTNNSIKRLFYEDDVNRFASSIPEPPSGDGKIDQR